MQGKDADDSGFRGPVRTLHAYTWDAEAARCNVQRAACFFEGAIEKGWDSLIKLFRFYNLLNFFSSSIANK